MERFGSAENLETSGVNLRQKYRNFFERLVLSCVPAPVDYTSLFFCLTQTSMKKSHLAAVLVLASCFIPQIAKANDSAFSGIAGTPSLLKGEHKQIRMESEKIVLTAQQSGFATSATFIFVNDSAKHLSIPMGFPELNYGDGWEEEDKIRKTSGFKRFATYVNGREVKAKRIVLAPNQHSTSSSDVWWLKTVQFAPRERKTVRVEAFSEYGGSVRWGFNHCVAYDFTGKNWKGKVSRSDLEIKVSEPALWSAVGESYESEQGGTRWKPNVKVENGTATIKKTWLNWQAQSTVYVGLWKALPFWMMEYPNSQTTLDKGVLENTVTFRTGGEAGKLGLVDYNIPQGVIKDGVPFVRFSHLKNRLDSMASSINEKNPAKVNSAWSAKDKTTTLQAGPIQLGFLAERKSMTVRKNGGAVTNVPLPAAPFNVRSESGYTDFYVPLLPAAKAIGLNVKVGGEKRRFSITRAGWLK